MDRVGEESFQLVRPIPDQDIIMAMYSLPNKESNITQLQIKQAEREDEHIGITPLKSTEFEDSSIFMRDYSIIPLQREDNDWVFVPEGEPFDSEYIQTPFQKQRSQSSSLEKTLSYIFTKRPRDYTNIALEKSLFPSGTGKCELSNPHGLAYEEETNRVFIADTDNNRIQVFSLAHIQITPTIIERTRSLSTIFMPNPKMNKPCGICVSNGYLYVTQHDAHCVDVYTNNRNFVSRFGTKGSGIGEFSHPTGICTNETHVFVCDSNNNRVQILKQNGKELKYANDFGLWKLKSPRDIKVFKSETFVLDCGKQCMHIYNSNYEHLRSFIANGERGEVDNPQYFDIDNEGNLLISDWLNHSIKVFEPGGRKIAEIVKTPTISSPLGIAVSMGGDVFVVDQNTEGHLKIF